MCVSVRENLYRKRMGTFIFFCHSPAHQRDKNNCIIICINVHYQGHVIAKCYTIKWISFQWFGDYHCYIFLDWPEEKASQQTNVYNTYKIRPRIDRSLQFMVWYTFFFVCLSHTTHTHTHIYTILIVIVNRPFVIFMWWLWFCTMSFYLFSQPQRFYQFVCLPHSFEVFVLRNFNRKWSIRHVLAYSYI